MSTWYEQWFNSDAYLKVYAHRDADEAEGLITFLTNRFQLHANSNVLDLCCGNGRHSIAFARKGCMVTGVDLSKTLIQVAQHKSAGMSNVTFIQRDVNQFTEVEKYDLVVNLFTSFGYSLDDSVNFTLFKTAFKALQPGGNFVFDYLNKENLEANLNPFSREIREGMFIEQFRWIADNAVYKRIVLQYDNRLHSFLERVKLYDKQTIASQLIKTGFSDLQFFGDYLGSPYHAATSGRLLVICKK